MDSDTESEISLNEIKVSPDIVVRIEILENPAQTSSGLFQYSSENSPDTNDEMLSEIQPLGNTTKKPIQI